MEPFRHAPYTCNLLFLDGHVGEAHSDGLDDPGDGVDWRLFNPFKKC